MPTFNSRSIGPNFSAASSSALAFKISTDTQYRINIDAGGTITWGPGGATAADTNLYRSAASALKTDDTFEAASGLITLTTGGAPTASIANGAIAVDTTNHAFYFRSGATWRSVLGTSLASGNIFVGNGSGVAAAVTMSGDVTISNTGSTNITSNSIVINDLANTTGEIAGAWNSDTSTSGFTNVTSGNISRRWLIIGKTMHFRAWFTAGTATTLAAVAFTLPASAVATSGRNQIVLAINGTSIVSCVITNGTGNVNVYSSTAGAPFSGGASLTSLTIEGTIELA